MVDFRRNALSGILPSARTVLGLDFLVPDAELSMDLTILLTDIESYTSAVDTLGDRRSQDLVRAHNRIVRAALSRYLGHEIKHTGDGIMAWFASAGRALAASVDIQAAVAARNLSTPGDPDAEAFLIRVGINTGEPIREDGDLFGTPVVVAARVADLAAGGQVLVTDVVHQLVAGKGFAFNCLGPVSLNGMSEPVSIFELDWTASASAAAELTP